MNRTFVILLFTAFLIAVISSLDGSFALQYTNYTSDKYQIQFQYPSTWQIVEKGSLYEDPSIEITDPSSGEGYIVLAIITIPDYEAKNSSDPYLNIRAMTELGLQILKNDSSYEHNLIEYPSYLTIDGRQAGTFAYMGKPFENPLASFTTKQWIVLVGDRYYTWGSGSNSDVFGSPDYTEIRDRFINSIKFLEPDNSPIANSTNLG